MPPFQIQMKIWGSTEPNRDAAINTFYLESDVLPITDLEALLDDANELWDTTIPWPSYIDRFTSSIRAVLAPPGDPALATRTRNKTSGGAGPEGPREVALCLSYYSGANTKRKRGRMYIGPHASNAMLARPSPTLRDTLRNLAIGIGNLGGVNVDWVQWSPTNNSSSVVTDFYIDDEWDTMRSRGRVATTRTTGTVDEGGP